MVAPLDDAPVVKNHDNVRIADGGKPMRNDEHRSSLHQSVHSLLHDGFGACVDRRRCFVEDHDGRVGNRRSCDGNELSLPLREIGAVVGQLGVVSLRQSGDEVVRARELRGGDTFPVGRVEFAVADVVHDRSREEIGLLQNDAERTAQVGFFDLIDVDPVVADLAVGDVVETIDQVGDRRFACARGSHERHLLPWLRKHTDVMQNGFPLFIGKIHVCQAHVAFELGVGQSSVLVRMLPCPFTRVSIGLGHGSVRRDLGIDKGHIAVVRFGLLIHERENAVGSRHCHHDRVDLLGDLVDVPRELPRHGKKRHHDTHADHRIGFAEENADARIIRAAHQKQAPDHDDNDVEQISDVHDDRRQHIGVTVGAVGVLIELVVDAVEVFHRLAFVVEHLDHFLPVHYLLHVAFLGAHRFLHADKEPCGTAAELARNKEHQKYARNHDQRQPRAVPKHDEEHTDNDRPRTDQRWKRLPDELAKRVDIVGIVAHNVAVLVGVEKPDGQVLHSVEHGFAHFGEKALRDIRGKLGLQRNGDQRDHVESDQSKHLRKDRRPRGRPIFHPYQSAVFIPNAIGNDRAHPLEKNGGNGCRDRREKDADDRDRHHARIILEKQFYHPPKHLEVHFALWGATRGHPSASAFTRHRHSAVHGRRSPFRWFVPRKLPDRSRSFQAILHADRPPRSYRFP